MLERASRERRVDRKKVLAKSFSIILLFFALKPFFSSESCRTADEAYDAYDDK